MTSTTVDESAVLADANSLERRAWELLEQRPDEAQRLLTRALRMREESQGRDHPDIIWTLSLWIEALRREHSLAAARKAAELGERRLSLKRRVVSGVPEELDHAIAELVELYYFEHEAIDESASRSCGPKCDRRDKTMGSRLLHASVARASPNPVHEHAPAAAPETMPESVGTFVVRVLTSKAFFAFAVVATAHEPGRAVGIRSAVRGDTPADGIAAKANLVGVAISVHHASVLADPCQSRFRECTEAVRFLRAVGIDRALIAIGRTLRIPHFVRLGPGDYRRARALLVAMPKTVLALGESRVLPENEHLGGLATR